MGTYSGIPDLQIHFQAGAELLPVSVVRQVFEYLALTAQDPQPTPPGQHDWQSHTAMDIGQGFEESTITIGYTPTEEQEQLNYYADPANQEIGIWQNIYNPDGTPGRPVAHWRSGISTGCDQEAFLMADGHLEWTEP